MTTPLLGTELILSLANGDEPSALIAAATLLRIRRDDFVALGAHDMSAWSDVSSDAQRQRGMTVLGAFCESCDVGVRMAFDSTGQPVPASPGRDVLPWPGRCAKASVVAASA